MAKVKVPNEVLKGIIAVRDSGQTNMLDRPAVVQLAAEKGYDETARWIETYPKEYSFGVFHGFEGCENE
jgi:hypothetical protein